MTEDKNARMEKVYQSLQAVGEKYQDVKKQLTQSLQQNASLQADYQTAITQAKATEKDYTALQQTTKALVGEKTTLESMVTEAGEQVKQVNDKYNKLQKDAETEKTGYEQAITELHEFISEKEGSISALTEQIDGFKTQQTAYVAQIADYTAQLETAQQVQKENDIFLEKVEGLLQELLAADETQPPQLPPN